MDNGEIFESQVEVWESEKRDGTKTANAEMIFKGSPINFLLDSEVDSEELTFQINFKYKVRQEDDAKLLRDIVFSGNRSQENLLEVCGLFGAISPQLFEKFIDEDLGKAMQYAAGVRNAYEKRLLEDNVPL